MYTVIPCLLKDNELNAIETILAESSFADGKLTASGAAQKVKNNLQLDRQSRETLQINTLLETAISQSPIFIETAQPRVVLPFLISRYMPGMEYGWHVDSPLMNVATTTLRADLSITIFLNSPEDYAGGELEIEGETDTKLFKLKKGDAVIYPTTKLHRVRPVTAGCRQVAVSWVQSRIRSTEQRDLLLQLKTLQHLIEQQQSGSPLHLLSQQVHSNLLRMFCEQ